MTTLLPLAALLLTQTPSAHLEIVSADHDTYDLSLAQGPVAQTCRVPSQTPCVVNLKPGAVDLVATDGDQVLRESLVVPAGNARLKLTAYTSALGAAGLALLTVGAIAFLPSAAVVAVDSNDHQVSAFPGVLATAGSLLMMVAGGVLMSRVGVHADIDR